ncbi:hypothetical protein ROZALSC1DRAFT_27909 [Rozella allomycis CSF55]|uniref:Uncharacterized protein n=1 Tax=Rozella allomycis (strain CSF55) TaxID=988480 RepID=A0A4P9YLT2_ROZAC|nr:hypothetical protein ROZALSC1DRAFT_27909 [Rozella allomycis CSF55]
MAKLFLSRPIRKLYSTVAEEFSSIKSLVNNKPVFHNEVLHFLSTTAPTKDKLAKLEDRDKLLLLSKCVFKNELDSLNEPLDYPYARHVFQSIENKTIIPKEAYLNMLIMCERHQDISGMKAIFALMRENKMAIESGLLTLYLSASLSLLENNKGEIEIAPGIEKIPYDSLDSHKVIHQIIEEYRNISAPIPLDALHMIIAHYITIFDYTTSLSLIKMYYSTLGSEITLNLGRYLCYQALFAVHSRKTALDFYAWLKTLPSEFQPDTGLYDVLLTGFMGLSEDRIVNEILIDCFNREIMPPHDLLQDAIILNLRFLNYDEVIGIVDQMMHAEKPPSSELFYRIFHSSLQRAPYVYEESYIDQVLPILNKFIDLNIKPCMEIKYGLARCYLKVPPSPSFMEFVENWFQSAIQEE